MELEIDIFSDVVCPWCFIGKRRLAAALAELRRERPEIAPKVAWRAFFLNPDTPRDGEPYWPFMVRKFGSEAEVRRLQQRVLAAGNETGIDFRFDRIAVRPNTLDAHRLIRHAQGQGEAEPLVERLFSAFFLEGENLSDRATLARLAAECGLGEDDVRRYLDSDAGESEVRGEAGQARGIGGVPFFIFDRGIGISGAQPPAVLLSAIERALSAR